MWPASHLTIVKVRNKWEGFGKTFLQSSSTGGIKTRNYEFSKEFVGVSGRNDVGISSLLDLCHYGGGDCCDKSGGFAGKLAAGCAFFYEVANDLGGSIDGLRSTTKTIKLVMKS